MSDYKVGDKFVVEIENKREFNSGDIFKAKGLTFQECMLDKFERLDSDYINEHFGKLQDEAYNAGLNDAWELAKKIVLNVSDGGIREKIMTEIFGGAWTVSNVLTKYTPQEALAKLEAYEKEQAEIKVGDVVTDGYSTMLVTGVGGKSGLLFMIGKDGEILTRISPKNWAKTGKHIDIQSILNQIGGEAE